MPATRRTPAGRRMPARRRMPAGRRTPAGRRMPAEPGPRTGPEPMPSEPPALLAPVVAALVFGPLLGGLAVYMSSSRILRDSVTLLLSLGLLVALALLSGTLLQEGPQRLALGGHAGPLGIEVAVD